MKAFKQADKLTLPSFKDLESLLGADQSKTFDAGLLAKASTHKNNNGVTTVAKQNIAKLGNVTVLVHPDKNSGVKDRLNFRASKPKNTSSKNGSSKDLLLKLEELGEMRSTLNQKEEIGISIASPTKTRSDSEIQPIPELALGFRGAEETSAPSDDREQNMLSSR